MPVLPELIVAHDAVPGRTRFRIKAIKVSPALAQSIQEQVLQTPGVHSVEVSTITGSVLVLFRPEATSTSALHNVIDALLITVQPEFGASRVRSNADSPGITSHLSACNGAALEPVPHLTEQRDYKEENRRGEGEKGRRGAIDTRHPTPDTRLIPTLNTQHLTPNVSWYTWTAEAVARHFHVVPDAGLSAHEIVSRLAREGRNEVPDIPRRARLLILREQIVSVTGLLLSTAALFALATGAVTDALFIGGAILANAAIGFYTEDYAERTIQSLRQTRTPHARLLRDGRRAKVAVEEVVPGDVLLLEPGHVVAADGRVVRSANLVMDESLLTGETAGQTKVTHVLPQADLPVADRANMVYAGSAVASGRGAAIVTATGLETELGRIRTLIGEAPDTPPPMSRELQRTAGTLALIATGVCTGFGILGLLLGLPPLEVLAVAASLAVSAIPEGLPTVSTTTLALGMKRMRAQNVVIRRLPAVATLGSSTILCVDKTGTLTENRMSVRCFMLAGEETEVIGTLTPDGIRFLRKGQPVALSDDPLLLSALQIGALCTEAELQRLPDGSWDAVGSATEQALLLTAVSAGIDVPRLKAQLALHELQERAPGRNFMVSVHKNLGGGGEVFVKGAPEELLALCSHARRRTGRMHLSPRLRKRLLAGNTRLAARGMRVLGLAQGTLQPGEVWQKSYHKLDWIGLVGMEDPVRSGAQEAIEQLEGAGIRTLMLTGDQRITAAAVARAVGLGHGGVPQVAESAAIQRNLSRGLPLPDVLARVTPADKFEIVRLLQEQGHVVMMTGDGINDAPALKAADVGIAMGARSTQVARDLSDVILLDDNLASLPLAVSHGRTIFANIRKSLRFMLASNLADMALVGASLILRLPLPLTAVQLLWINLVTDIFPAIALALEPAERQVMLQPPRPPQEPLLTRPLWNIITRDAGVITAAALGSYLWALGRYGAGLRARTIVFTATTMSEIAYSLACRTEFRRSSQEPARSNRYLAGFLGLSTAAQAGAVALPLLRLLLGTTPLALVDWLAIAATSGSVLGVTQALKWAPSVKRLTAPKLLPPGSPGPPGSHPRLLESTPPQPSPS